MITPFLAAAVLYCPTPELIDKTNTSLTEYDHKVLVMVNKEGCAKYNPEEPCLRQFIKTGDDSYTLVCGPKVERLQDPKK
jgi:hypothetical protein